MRKFVIAAAMAASTLIVAAPAAAQGYPGYDNGYGYNQGYGHNQGYGYNNYGQVRRLQARIDQLQHQINRLDRREILSEREARNLREESRGVEYRLRRAARYGLSGRERYDIERQIHRLEIRIQREARDGNRYGGHYGRAGWSDRDRDGLNDRYERDRGTNYDEDHDRD